MTNQTTRPIARSMLKLAALFAVALFGVLQVPALTLVGKYNGTTNYVSKSGSDANDGKSWATAKGEKDAFA